MTDRQLAPGQYYGTPAVRKNHSGCLVSEQSYGAGERLPKHSHEASFFCLLLSGNYCETYSTKQFDYLPCSIVYHPAGETHTTRMGSTGGRVFVIEIEPPLKETMSEFLRLQSTHAEPPKGPLSWLALQLYRLSLSGEQCPMLIEDLLLELLSRAALPVNQSRFAPEWLEAVVEYIHSRWNRPVTIKEIAAEVAIHPFHVSRVFRRFQGMNVAAYIHKLRIDRAKAILQRSPESNMCDLALDLGFADQSHFSRVFKMLTGVSPAVYRRTFE